MRLFNYIFHYYYLYFLLLNWRSIITTTNSTVCHFNLIHGRLFLLFFIHHFVCCSCCVSFHTAFSSLSYLPFQPKLTPITNTMCNMIILVKFIQLITIHTTSIRICCVRISLHFLYLQISHLFYILIFQHSQFITLCKISIFYYVQKR